MKTALEWIRYSDTDPRLEPVYPYLIHEGEYTWVLVFDEQEGIQIASKVWEDHEANEWHWTNETGTWLHYVTHWMPLPEPP